MKHIKQPVQHCCTHPGTGICMCDCHDRECGCGNYRTVMRQWVTLDSRADNNYSVKLEGD
jgi:hypothetical protein